MNTEFANSYDREAVRCYIEKRWWLGMTIGDILDKTADLHPAKEALVAGTGRYTYADLRSAADKMAFGLLANGFSRGDRVMLQLPNWPEFIIAHYALQKAGLVMVLLTVNHTAREISHLASLTEPKGWILPAKYREKGYLPLVRKVTGELPGLDKIIVAGDKAWSGHLNFSELLKCDADLGTITHVVAQARPDPTDVCYLLPTGGTTNLPKCAVRTHNDYVCNVEYKSRAWDMNTTDISLVTTTVGHNLALLVGISGPVFHGAKIVLVDSTRPQDFCQAIQDEKVTCASLVPTLVSRIVAYDNLGQYDLSSLIKIYVGAANSPPDLVKRVEKRIGCRYTNAFGMVEGPCSQTRPSDPLEVRSETIGMPVCPYDDFQTLDADGNKTPVGMEGELAARGPGIFSGYFRNSQTNQFAFTPDGYFRTGDLAVIDENKRIRITGRIKDVIIRGGENISARDVEDLISSHPAIEYVAAVGMPDEDLGEQVCAFVKLIDGALLTHEDIVTQMERQDAAKALIPACIEIVEKIPLTAAGKADKKVLKKVISEKIRGTVGKK
jgi:non-ribosomal peptide synthetase component E (peptide arylation enzyme)